MKSLLVLVLLLCNLMHLRAACLTLVWDPSACTNLCGYRLYYGPNSGTYTNSLWVGNATNATVDNLVAGGTYFFTATALNVAGAESLYSNEVQCQVPVPVTNYVVNIANLAQVYDGSIKTVTVATVPAGAAVSTTYNGSTMPPVAAGVYCVVATVTSTNGTGSATNTLVVAKACANVCLDSLAQTYDGLPKPVTANTVPPGLPVSITYNGSPTPPLTVGCYAVVGTVTDSNYSGAATNTLVVAKAAASLSFGSLAQTYDGAPKPVVANTVPAGLTVALTYNGFATPPCTAGCYVVVGTVTDNNYSGAATNTLTVSAASAILSVGGLSQTYNGQTKSVTVTTQPTNLAVRVTYNGRTNLVVSAGSYTVIATVTDPNGFGACTNTLVINKAAGRLTFSNLCQAYDGMPKTVTITTFPAGLAMTVLYDGHPTPPITAGLHSVAATMAASNYCAYATTNLWITQQPVVIAFSGLSQAYDGSPKAVSVTTQPPSVPVLITYNGTSAPPTNVGNYAVVVSVADSNYVGQATNTLIISDGGATSMARLMPPSASAPPAGKLLLSWSPTTQAVTLVQSPDLLSWSTLANGITGTNTWAVENQPGAQFFRAFVRGTTDEPAELPLNLQLGRPTDQE